MAGPRARLMTWIASQLGRPHGPGGGLIALMLNRSNRSTISAAVGGLDLRAGATAADLGFGGGIGLRLLLDRVGPQGRVHGVDLAREMVERASRRFATEVASGRLSLHEGSITALPLDDSTVDGAITVNTVYFIAELDKAFAEMARVLTPRGVLVVGIGDPQAMARMPMTPFGFRLRPVDEIVRLAGEGGLELRRQARTSEHAGAPHLLAFVRA